MTARTRLVGWAIASALRLQASTWRREATGLDRIHELVAARQRLLVVFWHGKYVPLFALLPLRGGCIFTTRSARGDVISEVCRRFSHHPIEIPEHDHDAALGVMRQALSTTRLAATAADGPLGPYHEVKHGLIRLASQTNATILPVSVAAQRKWILSRRWDRMEIPRFFTRVHVAAGEGIAIPACLGSAAADLWSERVRVALAVLDDRVEKAARKGTNA